MSENILLLSSWITAALLVAVSWFVHQYSKNMAVQTNYWKYISGGMLFFAASEIARPLFMFDDSLYWAYFASSLAGGIMVSYGFYKLYLEEKV